MNKSRMSVADLLYQCALRINNSLNDANVLNAVSQHGYTEEKLLSGKALLNESESLSQAFDKEYGEVSAAVAQRDKQQQKANTT